MTLAGWSLFALSLLLGRRVRLDGLLRGSGRLFRCWYGGGQPLDALQGGQGEGSRLARARLGGRDDVAACQHQGDGLLLYGCWLFEAEGFDPGKYLLV